MTNPCQPIEDFYKYYLTQRSGITASEATGPFGGRRVTYTVPSEDGNTVRVTCNYGIDTLRAFAGISVTLPGSVTGYIGRQGGRITPQGDIYLATSVSPVDSHGACHLKTIFSRVTLHLPVPKDSNPTGHKA